jgi:hypothetical protein
MLIDDQNLFESTVWTISSVKRDVLAEVSKLTFQYDYYGMGYFDFYKR